VPGYTLDAGALIAVERNHRALSTRLARASDSAGIAIPAGALAQVWRDGRRQARLARLLARNDVEIVALDERTARRAGELCGARGTSDIVDASVVLCAMERGHAIITSDAEDLSRLDPRALLIEV
jgi:PIN domain